MRVENATINDPIRLVQYLGSKLRSIQYIVPEINKCLNSNGTVLDLFSGTTVVGQSLVDKYIVYSNDIMHFSKILSDVFIVGPNHKKEIDELNFDFTNNAAFQENFSQLQMIFLKELEKELHAIEGSNLQEFENSQLSIPNIFCKMNQIGNISQSQLFSQFSENVNGNFQRSLFPYALFTLYYSGNYFGLHQSIIIDSLRYSLDHLFKLNRITSWQKNVYLASIIGALSKSVSSAGKHFAQPLLIRGKSQRSFALKRALLDRKIDIIKEAEKNIVNIQRRFTNGLFNKGLSFQIAFEQIENFMLKNSERETLKQFFNKNHINCIYADPPYTAQQYSRFYHILETFVLYDYPEIQTNPRNENNLTQGLYRKDRHYSNFSKKSSAHKSFESLFKFASEVTDYFILSYSDIHSNSGNPRMVSLKSIDDLANKYFKNVHRIYLSHNYRKLNKGIFNRDSNDPEILYIMTKKQ